MAEFNPFEFMFNLYQLDQQRDANDASQQALEEGFLAQNPWSPYQPAMAASLMNVLADPSQITQTPGYQFAYDQGLQSLFAKQAQSGNRFSGRALTETMQFGQGLASQMWDSEVDRMASLAGAMNPVTGGVTTGQNMSQLNQQDAFNQAYFWQDLWDRYSTNNNNTNTGSNNVSGSGGNPHA